MCQDVVIIDHGKIVLAGVVEELKAASAYRSLDIRVDGHPWVAVLPSGTVTSKQDGQVRVLVDASVDLEEILASARRVGEVTAFSFEPPSVADLFLEAVSEGRGT
ncbi:MAG TPA: DUF4162 domain-containing protein [Actinomycetota bacterium]|nr:DUF4162 domain-containing protein [Actinomycetota bacterium]